MDNECSEYEELQEVPTLQPYDCYHQHQLRGGCSAFEVLATTEHNDSA
jgi:hypothetical protein